MVTKTEEIVEREFSVGEGATLAVSNVAGRITIRGGEGGRIAVKAAKHGRESAVENTRIEMDQDGDAVTVRSHSEASGPFGSLTRQHCAVDYEIVVPPDCSIRAKGVSADISIAGVHAAVVAETVSGDVEVADAAGCRVSTVSGDVTGARLDGTLALNTTSGDATVDDSRLPDFNCHSVSGDLTLETPLTRGAHYHAKTVSGDLTLRVPAGTGATVQMKSVSGSVQSDLPAQIIKAGRRHWQGLINGGGANVEMHSVSGDLHIAASTTLEAVTAPGEASEGEPEARLVADPTDILEQLAHGEISVEDALARLRESR